MRVVAVLALLLVVATACRSAGGADPVATPATPSAAATSQPSRAGDGAASQVEPGLLVIDWSPRDGWDPGRPGAARGALAALDRATGEELPGLGPVLVGQAGSGLAAPDGSMVALVRHETQDSGSELAILDLSTFEAQTVELEAASAGWRLRWAPDGGRLFAVRTHCAVLLAEGRCVSAWEHQVWAVDPQGGAAALLFETDFWMPAIEVSADGTRLYALGVRTDPDQCCGIAPEGPPFIVVIDARGGDVLAEIPLPGVLIGQHQGLRGGPDIWASYTPGIALSPEGSSLYVVHPDENRITTVDLAGMEVAQTDKVRHHVSPLARLSEWLRNHFVSRAEAKGGLDYSKQAAVSADGRRLYISGTQDVPCPEVPTWCERKPLGLQVVDLASMRIVDEIPGVAQFAISPDGRWLAGIGTTYIEEPGRFDTVGHGARIIDLHSREVREVIAHLQPDVAYLKVAVSPDGRYAYLVSEGAGINHSGACERDCYRLAVVDMQRGEIVAERSFAGWIALVSLAPR